MKRLSQINLKYVSSNISLPSYDHTQLIPRIVHLGVGAFHRGHQAMYLENVLNKQGGDWGIIGASLRSTSASDQLNPQDGLYTVMSQGDTTSFQIIGCLLGIINARQEPEQLINTIASETVNAITLTITEKGYCHDPSTSQLDIEHPEIQKDINNFPNHPVTAIGFLVSGLHLRMARNLKGISLISCDNLPNNGQILRNVVLNFAEQLDTSLAVWIKQNITFPSSMVDRIVPATTSNDLTQVQQEIGLEDMAAVKTEPFSQWVIENDFASDMPEWQQAGVLLVDDVTPFEKIKLRLLNGSHSIIAYAGYLAGYDYVHQAIADPQLRQFIENYMHNVSDILDVPSDFDLCDYKSQLMSRFANPALQHKTAQIAMDGSQKIPQRWLLTIKELVAKNMSIDSLTISLAIWIRYLQAVRDNGSSYPIEDPLAERFRQITTRSDLTTDILIESIFKIESIFGDIAITHPTLLDDVKAAYSLIKSKGVKAILATPNKLPNQHNEVMA